MKMTSVDHSDDRYYEKITSIQQSMNKSSQIKCSKLRSYLKEISDREARAKMRNLELLRDVECIEINMKEYSPNHGTLQQQKADVLNKISKYMEKRMTKERDLEAAKEVHRHYQDISSANPAKDFTQPPTLMALDSQTSTGSDVDAGTTSVHSHQALHRSPNCSVHFRECLPSGLLKDFRVGGEDAASNRAHLSDDISGSNDSPDGCNLSDKHERTMAVLPSVRALTNAAGNVRSGSDDEQEPSPLVTLTGHEENLSPTGRGPLGANNPHAQHTDSQELTHRPPALGDTEKVPCHLMSQSTTGKKSQGPPDPRSCESTPSSDVKLSVSSATDLSISLTQSELDEDLPESEALDKSTASDGADDHSQNSPESSFHSEVSKNASPKLNLERLSQKGLFNLLDCIEGRLHDEQTNVYDNPSIDKKQLDRVISLCNSGAGLNDEDLKTCGAVVVHELQRLSWSTMKGCLLPQDLVSAHRSNTEPNEISASLPPDAAQLWDRWFKHALLLKERHVLSTEHLVQLFTPLLLERHATYSHQAKVLLRTLLSRSSEECPSAEDESDLSSSCGPSSLPADCGNVKPVQERIQELQSTEEDSHDESPVESVPIRETKAYQLLKQSAMQDRLQSSKEVDDDDDDDEEEEEDSPSGINHGHEEDLGRAKRSSHQDPYPRKERSNSKAHSVLLSKALWGESDDSNSEIEAALRPQPFNANHADVDDFYD
ncbi:centrosomal protein kizuna isoform X3 [Sphaeramia orbicularis]|uniref:centrosomal protein kizuna isoform X3 n=1 Tax=Sphaeramia orbicularis TaxID=375764 RepID=UPI00117D51CC|nr:centrosomal protein kizuna isoform X3 [Sphaeramia orbicularis]